MHRILWVLGASLNLAACTQAPAPTAAQTAPAETAPATPEPAHDDLRRALQEPIDQARAVEQTLQQDADATARAIEDAGG